MKNVIKWLGGFLLGVLINGIGLLILTFSYLTLDLQFINNYRVQDESPDTMDYFCVSGQPVQDIHYQG